VSTVPRHRRGRRRPARGLSGLGLSAAVVIAVAVLITGCATHDALGLAQKACTKVESALALYARSQSEEPGSQGGADAAASVNELRVALPIAAVAAGESPQWQALMTTLTEAGRVPEGYLVHALSAQCAAAEANGNPGP